MCVLTASDSKQKSHCASVEFNFISVQVCRLEFFITKARVEMVFQASIIDTQQGLCVCPMKYGTLRASSGAEAVGFDHRYEIIQ